MFLTVTEMFLPAASLSAGIMSFSTISDQFCVESGLYIWIVTFWETLLLSSSVCGTG